MAQTIYDDFVRADAGTLGANWSVLSTLTSFRLTSNRAETSGTVSNHGNVFTANGVGGVDQYVEATDVQFGSNTDSELWLYGRITAAGTETGYAVNLRRNGTLRFLRTDAGSSTEIATTTVTAGTGRKLRLEIEGVNPTQLRAYVDDVLELSHSDSTTDIETGDYVGIRAHSQFSSNYFVDFNTFEAGTLVASVPSGTASGTFSWSGSAAGPAVTVGPAAYRWDGDVLIPVDAHVGSQFTV